MTASSNNNLPQVFAGKVIAVTGAARGMGLATSQYLVRRGATVLMSDVLEAELKKAGEELAKEGEVATTVVDITNKESVESWLNGGKQKYGKIDAAVNNAGICIMSDLATMGDAEFDRTMAVNVKGTFNCLRAEIKLVEDGGSIVNLASVAGLRGLLHLGAYSASKHAVVGLTKSAAREVAERGVRVNAVCPGVIATDMAGVLKTGAEGAATDSSLANYSPLKRQGRPEEIASLIGYLLGDESKFTTGSIYACDGGLLVNGVL